MPRSIAYVVLSILLLISQQMALLHGVSHWADVRGVSGKLALAQQGPDSTGKLPKTAVHDLCAQCAASAELASALPATVYVFLPATLAASVLATTDKPGVCLLLICAFQPRSPPQA